MLNERTQELCKEANYATLTTLFADGSPQTNVMWVDCDGEHVLINTERERAKARNVARDPRVAVTVWDRSNPFSYAEVRGRVVDIVGGDRARAHIDELARKYTEADYANPIGSERVMLVIAADRELVR